MEKIIERDPSRFQTNLALCEKKIGAPLNLQPLTEWEFCHTGEKQLLNLKGKAGQYLHYPESIDEELDYWQSSLHLKHSNILVVYGIGLGYYYLKFKEQLEKESTFQLIFIEDDPQMLRAFLETTIAEEVLSHPQVVLLFESDRKLLPINLEKNFNRKNFSGALFTALIYYAKEKKNDCNQKLFLVDLLSAYYIKKRGEFEFGSMYYGNYLENFLELCDMLYAPSLYHRFEGFPAIICGAGPSLEKNIHILKGLKNKALIFAGGTAMNALNANGVLPHFGVGIDPFEAQVSRIMENNAFLIPYFVNLRMNAKAVKALLGDKLFMPTMGEIYPLFEKLEKDAGFPKPEPLETGFNVVNYSLSIAEKLGCNPIFCVGVDLAYTGGKSYAPNVRVHGTYDPVKTLVTRSPVDEIISIEDIYGNPIQTQHQWMIESNWYGGFKNRKPKLQIYNCTEGGIGFVGIPNLPLKEAAEKHLKKELNIEGKIAEELKRAREFPIPTKSKLRTILLQLSDEVYALSSKLKATSNPEQKKEYIDQALKASESDNTKIFLNMYEDVYSEPLKYTFLEKNLLQLYMCLLSVLMEDISETMRVAQGTVPVKGSVYYYEDNSTIRAVFPSSPDVPDGTFFYYYKNGVLKRSIEYNKGVRSGWDRYYNEKGILLSEVEYDAGLPKGIGKVFNDQGKLIKEIKYSSPGVIEEVLKANRAGELIPDITYERGYEKYAIEKTMQVQKLISKLSKAIAMVGDSSESSLVELGQEIQHLESLMQEMKELGGMNRENYKEMLWSTAQTSEDLVNKFTDISNELKINVEKIQEALFKLQEKRNDGKF